MSLAILFIVFFYQNMRNLRFSFSKIDLIILWISAFFMQEIKSRFFSTAKFTAKNLEFFYQKLLKMWYFLLSKKRYQIYLHSMNTQRARNKNVLTANFFETDFKKMFRKSEKQIYNWHHSWLQLFLIFPLVDLYGILHHQLCYFVITHCFVIFGSLICNCCVVKRY